MQLVRAGLQGEVHRTGAGVADLGVVGRRFDLELFNRVGRRLDAGARLRYDVARSVDREFAVDRPRDRHAAQVVVVHRPLQRVRPLERRAWNQPRQAIRGAIPERNLADEGGVDDLSDRRAAGFELRALTDNQHRFGHARGRQRGVQLHTLADMHLHALILALLEAAQLDGDVVRPRQQQHGGVLPRVVRRLHDRGIGPDVSDRDRHSRQCPARGVDDETRNRSA